MPFPYYYFVVIQEVPMGTIPAKLGSGPQLPVVKTVNTTGAKTFVSLGIPPGVALTITLSAGGGGGGGKDGTSASGGGGGGGGAGVMFTIAPEQWYPDGGIDIGNPGEGGSGVGHDGGDAADSMCEWKDGSVLVNGGKGGKATGGVPGAGGDVEFTGTGAVIIRSHSGYTGSAGITGFGGAGGAVGLGTSGAGGKGGSVSVGDLGGLSRCVIEFNLPSS